MEENLKNGKVDDTQISLLDVSAIKVVPVNDKQKKKDVRANEATVSGFLGLFKYGTKFDVSLMLLGIMFSCIQGVTMPILGLVFGQMTNILMRASIQGITDTGIDSNGSFSNSSEEMFPILNVTKNVTGELEITVDEFNLRMNSFALYYLIIGCVAFCSSFLQNYLWETSCERQVFKLRKLFFSQILRQEISWYDLKKEGDLSSKLSDDIERIREGIGHKFSMVTQYLSSFISGICVGLYANWRLTCALLGVAPLLIGTSAVTAKMASSSASREQLKYSLASGIADEVLMCLRTVTAFGGENKESKRYGVAIEEGRRLVMKKYHFLAIVIFVIFFIIYGSYAVAFWYGANLIGQGISTPGSVFAVFFSVMTSAFSIGNILPYVNAVSTAIGSAANIYSIICRVPKIDSYSQDGLIPKKLKGKIEFKDVFFSYPTRKEIEVFKGFTLQIKSGEKVAVIGPSGSGKSTLVNLILRFYDTTRGQICIDSNDVKDLNLKWLRSNVGVVSQEPVLFGVSIAENVRYGKEDISMADIEQACKLANAHSFIKELPEGYNTQVGSRGGQLSGGQKQRIAIARALVRDPKILLLDEATSALDSQSEGVVQEALDNAMVGRTTIIIAHRLSTIRNADKIFALQNGILVESGTHEELMAKKGLYYNLVMTQTKEKKEEELFMDNEENEDQNHQTLDEMMSSTTSLKSKGLSEEENVVEKDINYLARLTKMNANEWHYLVLGMLSCICVGSISPIFAYFYGEFFSTFSLRGAELDDAIQFWSLMFVALGVISGASYWLQTVALTSAAEALIARIRWLSFTNILHQEISWFDNDKFAVSRLITRLARDAPIVKAAAGMRAGSLTSAMVTLCAGVFIAVVFGWKLALLLSVGIPVLIYSGYKHLSLIRSNQIRDAALMDNAGKVASECLQNIRTVQSLGKEDIFTRQYIKYLELPFRESKKQAIVFALTFAVSQAVLYFLYASGFRFGSYLITIGEMTPSQVYRVFFALSFCATAVGTSTAYLQDWSKARMSAKLIFEILDKKSALDPTSVEGLKPEISGKVSFENIVFSYPSRKHIKILRGLTVSVEAGQTLALVGGSGCGKSTVIALLERFYMPDKGDIYIDDCNISLINVSHLRAQLGLVTQEPDLFNCSIKENIAYGALHQNVSDHNIIEAAKTANIHEFISSLPQGYDTICGERGTQLSGGQKQRIAIARAIVRNPKILLLDEATSALDTESEKIVQEALDRAREGRTSIVIAHRLSTIQNADKIAVIQKGRIVEIGTHDELKAKEGFYFQLTKRQQL